MNDLKHLELRKELLARIRRGDFPTGRLDSEPELCRRYGLSRSTVRRTLGELEAEGVLRRVRGKGTFLHGGDTHAPRVAFIVYDTDYLCRSVTSSILRGIDSALAPAGILLDVLASRRSARDETFGQLARRYAGVLIGAWQLETEFVEELRSTPLPWYFVKNYLPGMESRAFRIDYRQGGALAARDLLAQGRRRFGFLCDSRARIADDLLAGIRDAIDGAGAELPEENICRIDERTSAARESAIRELFRGGKRPDALLCFHDGLAAAALEIGRELGFDAPRDYGIAGCNDEALAAYLRPPLTSLRLPTFETGRAAGKAIAAAIRGEAPTPVPPPLPVELIRRVSTENPRKVPTTNLTVAPDGAIL